MLKKILFLISFVFVFFLTGCFEDERIVFGKIIFINDGVQQNIFKHKLTFIVVVDKNKKIHCVVRKKRSSESFNLGDAVRIKYNRYTAAVTMQEIEIMGKIYKGLCWKNLLSIDNKFF